MSNQLSAFVCDCIQCRVASLQACICDDGIACPAYNWVCNVPASWDDLAPLVIGPEGGGGCDHPSCCPVDTPCEDPEDCCYGIRPDIVVWKCQYQMGFSRRADFIDTNECGQLVYCQSGGNQGGPAMDCGGAVASTPPVPYWADPNLLAKVPNSSCSSPKAPVDPKWKCVDPNCQSCGQLGSCVSCGAPGNPQNPDLPQVCSDGVSIFISYNMTSPGMEYIDCEREENDGVSYVKGNYQGYGECQIPITYIDYQCIGDTTQTSGQTPNVDGWRRMGCTGQPAAGCPGCTPSPSTFLRTPGDCIGNTTTSSFGARGNWYCSISVPYGLNNYCEGGVVYQTVRFVPDDDGGGTVNEWLQETQWVCPPGTDVRAACSGISDIYHPAQDYVGASGTIDFGDGMALFDYYGYLWQIFCGGGDMPHGASLSGGSSGSGFGCGSFISPSTPISQGQPHLSGGNLVGPNYIYENYGWRNRTYGGNFGCTESGGDMFQGGPGCWYQKAYASGITT